MRRSCIIYLALILTAILVSLTSTPTLAQLSNSETISPKRAVIFDDLLLDNRANILTSFLQKYNSPLTPYSSTFILAADTYGLDWRLVPAITGVESTFGKRIPFNSFNAYGWNNGNYKFKSWEDSIWHVSRVLKEKYIDRGLTTVPKIAQVYAPPSPTWENKVLYFMEKISPIPIPAYKLDL